MKMLTTMKMAMAVLTASMLTTAVADDASPMDKERSTIGAEAKFDALDRNNDQQLSRNEARSQDELFAQFGSVDADSDGYVSKSEYTGQAETQSSRPHKDTREPYNR